MRKLISTLFILVFTLGGCQIVKEKSAAEKVAHHLYKNLEQGNIKKALTYYSSDFFQTTDQERWKRVLLRTQEKLGTYHSHKLQHWYRLKGKGPLGEGIYVELKYLVQYSKHEAEELLLLKLYKDHFLIIVHTINSIGLEEEKL